LDTLDTLDKFLYPKKLLYKCPFTKKIWNKSSNPKKNKIWNLKSDNLSNIIILFFIYSLMKIHPLKNIYNGPKISIYIPIYNKSKYLIKSIKSIQCQTLKEIEIIAVNDFSSDNSLSILKEIAKNDSRIKIVNNDKNYGLLYTRTMGILKATGEYIINVDPDDLLNGNNTLEYLYNIANKLRVDVINFGYLNGNESELKCLNFKKILRQPQLLKHAFTQDNRINDYLLWNKLVKRKLMLQAYELFKNKIYSEKWNYGEDTIWSIIINKYAKSMFCINKIFYIYNLNEDSLMHNQFNIIRIKDIFNVEEMYRKILNENKEKKYLIAHIRELIYEFNFNKNSFSSMKFKLDIKNHLISLLKIYMQDYHIPYDIIYNFISVIFYY
jgi:glycosyltransferase involved in cell wall biosynthesis